MQTRTITPSALLLSVLLFPATAAHAQVLSVTAGANMFIDFNQEIDVPYSGFVGQYYLDAVLIHDPWAGPFFKLFQSPITDTGDPILLDPFQPMPQRVTENYFLPPILAPFLTLPVAGWHEEIVTDGWEWVLPGDTRFPDLFPPGQALITKDGEPHPWTTPPMPAVHQPNKLWVEFPPIGEGFTLDIHKALLWVGTPGNRIWGDNVSDDGAYVHESSIRVFEYPVAEHANGLPGDLNSDGFVGIADLNIVLGAWNQTVPPGDPLADPTGDGFVGIADLNVVLDNWNAGTPPGDVLAQVPEPGSVSVLALCGLVLLRHRD